MLPTIILRHRKENLKKCSLQGIHSRKDFLFFTYPQDTLPNLSSYLLLTLDAPPLQFEDRKYGLFIIDGTWRYVKKIEKQLNFPICRSIPSNFKTAYPRRQLECPFPQRGLASVEAIYIAYYITQRDTSYLLNHYYWKEDFLKKNFS